MESKHITLIPEKPSIHRDGVLMVRNGYKITDIRFESKASARKRWQDVNNALTEETCLRFPESSGAGVLMGVGPVPVVALDCDIKSPSLAKAFFDKAFQLFPSLASTICRIGMAPKALFLVRASEAHWRKAKSRTYTLDGEKCNVEVLCEGQQAVFAGIHPGTHKPYEYHNTSYEMFGLPAPSPMNTKAEDLPVFTIKQVQRFLDLFNEVAQSVGAQPTDGGWADKGVTLMSGEDAALEKLQPRHPVGLTIEEVRSIALDYAKQVQGYDDWIKLLQRIHHETSGSDEGLAVAVEVSRAIPGFKSEQDVAYHWASFRNYGAQLTMWPLVREVKKTLAWSKDIDLNGLIYRTKTALDGRIFKMAGGRGATAWALFAEGRWYFNDWASAGLRGFIQEDIILEGLKAEAAQAKAEGDEERYEALVKFHKQCCASIVSIVSQVMTGLDSEIEKVVARKDFDANLRYFGVRNGVVDLYAGKLIENRPDLMVSKHTNWDYDPTASCSKIIETIREYFQNDVALANYLIRLLANALAGEDCSHFVCCVGTGANGKSTLFNVLRELFGPYCASVSDAALVKNPAASGGASPELVSLIGARLVICSETEQDSALREHIIKQITGMEDMTVRALYCPPETFRPHALPLLGTNYRPNVRGSDDGIWRRVKLIPFRQNYEKDPVLKKKCKVDFAQYLMDEVPGFFNLLLELFIRFRGQKPEVPAAVKVAVDEYRNDSDTVRAFATERLIEDPQGKVQTSTVYAEFMAYLQSEGISWRPTQRAVTERLKKILGIGAFSQRTRFGYLMTGYRLVTAMELANAEVEEMK